MGTYKALAGLTVDVRHSFHPFVEGVMERTYTDEELENIDRPPIEFEGKTYSIYECTQFQRRLENSIRHWKRREAAATNPKDALAAKARIRVLKAKCREFSEAAGLRTQEERMRVYIPKGK